MQVKTVVETPEGFVKFEGELSASEAEYVLGVGLNLLLQQGATFGALQNDDEEGTLQ